jgi:glycosyltransferase involved in cell wall biosynthesis
MVRGQRQLGLNVGLICDSSIGDRFAEEMLSELAGVCTLGVYRAPMSRYLNSSDIAALGRLFKFLREMSPDIIHGHGAKGGAYARLLATRVGAKSIYTPHGGSLHYAPRSSAGLLYLTLERLLSRRTDGLIFESGFSADAYVEKIAPITSQYRIIYNGLHEKEFTPVQRNSPCKDFVYVGELRKLKGVDILLQALYELRPRCWASLLIVGSGPDAGFFHRRIRKLGLEEAVTVSPPMFPSTRAFARARVVVVPSLAESFPYIVLEAAAAKMPILATKVGGVPEIFGPYADHLLPPGKPTLLADAMQSTIEEPARADQWVEALHEYVRSRFKIDGMVQATVEFYSRVI